MAVLNLGKIMPFWSIKVGGQDITSMMKKYIEGASFEYSLDGPTTGQIQVTTNSFIEDIFREGTKVEFWLGWDRNHLAKMIDGIVEMPPDGSAKEIIGYTMTIVDKSIDLAKKAKTRSFKKNPTKSYIIQQIAADYGYTAETSIEDAQSIIPKEIPLQQNQTDLEFLYMCSIKWNCLCWIDAVTKIIYFFDSDKAHEKGNELRNKNFSNISDITGDYELGYRASKKKNNIAGITWKFDKPQGGSEGQPGVSGAGEGGTVTEPKDYDVFFDDTYYKLKPEIAKKLQESPRLGFTYSKLVLQAESGKAKELLREYFVPLTHGSSTNKNLSHMPEHKKYKIQVNVELNEGDPFLRPPRTAWLYSGSQTNDSDLPSFLFKDNKEKQKYNINKVKTELVSGMINTSMELTI